MPMFRISALQCSRSAEGRRAARDRYDGLDEASGLADGEATGDFGGVLAEAAGSLSFGFNAMAFLTSASPCAVWPLARSSRPRFRCAAASLGAAAMARLYSEM